MSITNNPDNKEYASFELPAHDARMLRTTCSHYIYTLVRTNDEIYDAQAMRSRGRFALLRQLTLIASGVKGIVEKKFQ